MSLTVEVDDTAAKFRCTMRLVIAWYDCSFPFAMEMRADSMSEIYDILPLYFLVVHILCWSGNILAHLLDRPSMV